MFNKRNPRRAASAMTFFASITMTVILLAGAMGAAQRSNSVESDGSNSRTAVMIVRANWSDQQVPLNHEILTTLMHSSSVRAESIRELLGTNGGVRDDDGLVELEISMLVAPDMLSADSPYLIRFSLLIAETNLEGEPIPARAEELLRNMLERLRASLKGLAQQNHVNLNERVDLARQHVKKAKTDLHGLLEMRRAMSQEAQRVDLTRDAVVEELRWMEEQRRELEIERVSKMARRAAVEAQIAKATDAAMNGGSGDAALNKLEEMTDTHRMRIADLEKLYERGSVSSATIAEAKLELMEMQVRLEERRAMVSERAGGEQLPALQQELAELSIQSAEMEARYAFAKERAEALRPTLALADRIENEVLIALPGAQERLAEALERLHRLESALELFRAPQLSIVGPENKQPNQPR